MTPSRIAILVTVTLMALVVAVFLNRGWRPGRQVIAGAIARWGAIAKWGAILLAVALLVGALVVAVPVIWWWTTPSRAADRVEADYARAFPEARWSVDCLYMADSPGQCDAAWTPRRDLTPLEYYRWQKRFQEHAPPRREDDQWFDTNVRPTANVICPGLAASDDAYPAFQRIMGWNDSTGPPVRNSGRTVAQQMRDFTANDCRIVPA